jgi:hypothetical protein
MLCRETIAVCSEIHTKHINTLCGQNVQLLNVRPGGTYSNQRAAEGQLHGRHPGGTCSSRWAAEGQLHGRHHTAHLIQTLAATAPTPRTFNNKDAATALILSSRTCW